MRNQKMQTKFNRRRKKHGELSIDGFVRGHLDSGSTLCFPVKELQGKTESSSFIDTRVVYRSARNDDCRDDSL